MKEVTKKAKRRLKKIESIAIFKEGRYYYGLLLMMILFSIAAPFFNESQASEAFFGTALVLMLFYCVLSISERKRFVTLSLILAIPLIAKSFQPLFHDVYEINTLFFSLSGAVFMLMVISMMISDIFKTDIIDGPIIVGSVSIYILVGIFFGFIYLSIEYCDNSAFNLITQNIEVKQISDMIYFSFSTLTTLGYGDIVPVSMMAKIVSSLEAIFGQIFLAVLVTRLIGLSIVHSHNKKKFFKL